MKICLISNLYPPDIMGGAELYVERVVKKLAENHKNQIIVITTNQRFSLKTQVEEKENIKIYRIWPLNLYSLTTKRKYNFIFKAIWHLIDLWNPFVYFAIKKILKKEKPDLVHTHNFAGLSFSVFSAVKSLGIKTIHTCHDYYLLCPYANLVCPLTPLDSKHLTGLTGWKFPPQKGEARPPRLAVFGEAGPIKLGGRKVPPFFCQAKLDSNHAKRGCKLYRQITRAILKNKIDVVLTPSKFVMDAHLKNGFFATSQQIILPLGINNLIYNSSFKIHDSFNILCVSQLAPHKGVSVLLHAIHNSKFLIHNSRLMIVGDGTERKNLEKLAEDNKNIIFCGKLSYKETQKKYQEADVVIIPSLAPETFSLVMFEAMNAGKPVIASKIGALEEYIKDGETGFLFEPGNVNQLKEILEKVINDPDLIKKIGHAGQQFAQEFTFQKHWEKLKEIYQYLI